MKFLIPFRRLAVALGLAAAFQAHAAATRPNVLIVLLDDVGYGDFSCHAHPFLKTPHIDRLHGESVRFTDFHVAPMCTPTRGALMTGLDPLRNGATSVTAGRAFLRPGLPMMPELFAAAGWRTGIFGKWHLGDSFPHRPMDKGFQTAVWMRGWGFTSAPEFSNTLFDGRCMRGDKPASFTGHVTDFCFDEAMSWMRSRSAAKEPFLCYLPLHAAHSPHTVAEKYSQPLEAAVAAAATADGKAKKGAGVAAAKFFGMIAQIDENMGRLESFLRDTGLRENTILIFMTDNGGTAGVRFFNAGLRAGKTTYYDGGHRVPCFVRWPAGNLRPPGDLPQTTCVQDVLPTLMELCSLPAPPTQDSGPGTRNPFEGMSLAGALRGKAEWPDRMLVVQYGPPPSGKLPEKWDSCVLWNQWRLVHGRELYDVRADRAQERDLAAQQPGVLARMRAHYEQWWSQVAPGLTNFVPLTLGSDRENPVHLSSSDWQDVYADNSNHIRNAGGGPRGGPWNVLVERDGTYEITVRRWPFDVDVPLGAADVPTAKAFPNVASAKLTIAGKDLTSKAPATDAQTTFTTTLPKGRTQLQAWFQDAQGRDLCGAFYARVRRK
jgi:arylsulfatase